MLHKNDFRAFVLLMMLLPAGGLLSQTAGNPATFDGQVMNRSSGRPLAGVEIALQGSVPISKDPWEHQQYSATSGADGRFVISGIAPGEYFISVARPGYKHDHPGTAADKDSMPQQTFAPGGSVHSVLFMSPLPIITGRVLDSKGVPMEHVDVHAIGTEDSQYPQRTIGASSAWLSVDSVLTW